MREYIGINNLEYKKNKIKDKEEVILKSQVKQNKLETKIKKLNKRKENIINKKTNLLEKIVSYLIYDIVIIVTLILFIKICINSLILTTSIKLIIYIIEMYIGVTVISITGAIISSKVETLLKEYLYKPRINKITEIIKIKEESLQTEINLQEEAKRDITKIMNNSEEYFKENIDIEHYYNTVDKNCSSTYKKKVRKL